MLLTLANAQNLPTRRFSMENALISVLVCVCVCVCQWQWFYRWQWWCGTVGSNGVIVFTLCRNIYYSMLNVHVSCTCRLEILYLWVCFKTYYSFLYGYTGFALLCFFFFCCSLVLLLFSILFGFLSFFIPLSLVLVTGYLFRLIVFYYIFGLMLL